jgi:hypothetical protein
MTRIVALLMLLAVANCTGTTPAFADNEKITWSELLRQYTIEDKSGNRLGVIKERPMNPNHFVIEDKNGNRVGVVKCDRWWCEKEKKK